MPPAVLSEPLHTENFSGLDWTILPLPASQVMKLPMPPWLPGAGNIDSVAPTYGWPAVYSTLNGS
jgi:hypothetical protein